jgi:hypothetical protein
VLVLTNASGVDPGAEHIEHFTSMLMLSEADTNPYPVSQSAGLVLLEVAGYAAVSIEKTCDIGEMFAI